MADEDDVKQSIRMTADRILVRPSDEIGERKSRAGILIPATADANRRLVWAQVVATPVSTTWDAGDGTPPLVCAGPGTPYDTSRPESSQSTDCSHTYRSSSADQPQTGPDSKRDCCGSG